MRESITLLAWGCCERWWWTVKNDFFYNLVHFRFSHKSPTWVMPSTMAQKVCLTKPWNAHQVISLDLLYKYLSTIIDMLNRKYWKNPPAKKHAFTTWTHFPRFFFKKNKNHTRPRVGVCGRQGEVLVSVYSWAEAGAEALKDLLVEKNSPILHLCLRPR